MSGLCVEQKWGIVRMVVSHMSSETNNLNTEDLSRRYYHREFPPNSHMRFFVLLAMSCSKGVVGK